MDSKEAQIKDVMPPKAHSRWKGRGEWKNAVIVMVSGVKKQTIQTHMDLQDNAKKPF